jgi:hypothetical protein
MKPEKFKSANLVLGAPQGWDAVLHGPCVGLPVFMDEQDGTMCSCWKPTWREALGLLFGRRLWLTIASGSHPPVALEVHPRG